MPNHLDWHGAGASDYVERRVVRVLSRAAVECSRRAKELLSVPGTGKQAGTGGKRGAKKVYNAFPSAPGEPPHKQTGRLRASVQYEVDEPGLTARVGTNLPYGAYLELGTKKGLAPRPWLRRALDETAARINSILAGLGE
jgi:phage gpG-like protein